MKPKLRCLLLLLMLLPIQIQAQSLLMQYEYNRAKAKQEELLKKQKQEVSTTHVSDIVITPNKSTQTNSNEVEDLKKQVEELQKQVNSLQNSGNNRSNAGTQTNGGLQSRQEFKQCFSCGGTKKCHQCLGNGTVVTWAGTRKIEQVCPGCARSGICPFCHGSGGTYETVYY